MTRIVFLHLSTVLILNTELQVTLQVLVCLHLSLKNSLHIIELMSGGNSVISKLLDEIYIQLIHFPFAFRFLTRASHQRFYFQFWWNNAFKWNETKSYISLHNKQSFLLYLRKKKTNKPYDSCALTNKLWMFKNSTLNQNRMFVFRVSERYSRMCSLECVQVWIIKTPPRLCVFDYTIILIATSDSNQLHWEVMGLYK